MDKRPKQQIEGKIHQYLYTHNKDYKSVSDSFAYTPMKLTLLPKNTFVNYLENKKGGTFAKVCRVYISDEELGQLLSVTNSSTKSGS